MSTPIQTAAKMLDVRDTMKRLNGDKWEEASKPYRAVLLGLMRDYKTDNPLAVALPVAKDMEKKGHSPLMLLAVAADMADE